MILYPRVSIYITAPVVQVERCKDLVDYLKTILRGSFDIRSSWVKDPRSGYNQGGMERKAIRDFNELDSSSLVICLYLPGSSGGMFAELGYALAKKRAIYAFAFPVPSVGPSDPGYESADTPPLKAGLVVSHPSIRFMSVKTQEEAFSLIAGVVSAHSQVPKPSYEEEDE